jgi:hypothetical protein
LCYAVGEFASWQQRDRERAREKERKRKKGGEG